MPRPLASLFVKAEDVEVTVDVAAPASVEVAAVQLAEGPSVHHRQGVAASGEDTEENGLVGSLPTYRRTG